MLTTDSILYESCPDGEKWGAGCLLIRNNALLMGLRTDNKLWCSPGGGIEPGETPIQGIIREIKEEVNIDVNEFFLSYIGQTYSLNENSIWRSFVFVCSIFSSDGLKPQTKEMSELKWVPIADIDSYNLFSPTRMSLSMALQMHPELLYPDIYDIFKLTSLEQLVDIKNPGSNGGNGQIGIDGNWKYTKPTPITNTAKNTNPASSSPAGEKTVGPQPIKSNAQIDQLKQSYMQHFQKTDNVKQVYTLNDGQFNFPDCATAIKDGIVKDKESYRLLFNEQYMLFVMSQ